MGHRLTRIVTRTGDDGTTGLADGTRLPKDAPLVEALGNVDELNSAIGLLLTEDMPDVLRRALTEVQHELFDLGGELSVPGLALLQEAHLARLDALIEDFNAGLPPLKEFILPGGARAAALCHVARTVCRRAERSAVSLLSGSAARPLAVRYLNRLSDLLFIACRLLNRHHGVPDVLWRRDRGGA